MIFEKLGKHTGNLKTFQGDYGTPVIFKAGADQGFQQGEVVIFTFENDAISDKEYAVIAEDFTLSLALTKPEADALYSGDISGYFRIPFSAKRYSESGVFLETVLNGFLFVYETVEWGGVLEADNG